jgi:hypothetical protein
MSNTMIADRDVVIRPAKEYTTQLTKSEIRILQFYRSIGKVDSSLGTGLRFRRSLKTIAAEIAVNEKTIRRANDHFAALGILSWISGNSASWRGDKGGQASKYRLVLSGLEGFAVARTTLQSIRKQLRVSIVPALNSPNTQQSQCSQ